jgi:carbon-monoxide dehydrogenase medium subunit
VHLKRFLLHRPESLAEAFELRRRHGEEAAYYAGGTELLLAMKLGLARFAHLIDLKRIPDLHGVEVAGGVLRIGAAATHHQLERDPLLRSHFPTLADLEGSLANIRVRVAGTLAGNLAFADPRADPPALLVALGARLRLASPDGEATCLLSEFFRGPLDTTARAWGARRLPQLQSPGEAEPGGCRGGTRGGRPPGPGTDRGHRGGRRGSSPRTGKRPVRRRPG